jgi:DNA-binding transcriptional LysR family regulator
MKLNQLRYFVAVAEELHFGRAASRLHIAQPPLSRQIRELEVELGLPLFTRTKRRVGLTDAGRTLLDEARVALAQLDHAADAARRAGQREIGQLVVGVVPTVDHEVFTRILRSFANRYPSPRCHRSLSTAAQVGLLMGTLRPTAPHAGQDDGLVVKLVSKEPLVAALPSLTGSHLSAGFHSRHSPKLLVIFPRQLAPGYYTRSSACSSAGLHLNRP